MGRETDIEWADSTVNAQMGCDGWMFGSETAGYRQGVHEEDAADLYRVGKGRSGNVLDGRTWEEMPRSWFP